MSNSKPRDVQVLPIATNTKILRSRSWSRLRFEIEYALERGTTSNCYLIEGDKTAIIDPPGETFTEIYLEALQQTINVRRLDYVILGHFNPNRVATQRQHNLMAHYEVLLIHHIQSAQYYLKRLVHFACFHQILSQVIQSKSL